MANSLPALRFLLLRADYFLGMVEASHGEVVWLCARATMELQQCNAEATPDGFGSVATDPMVDGAYAHSAFREVDVYWLENGTLG